MATPTAIVRAPATRHATRSGALDGLRGFAAVAVVLHHMSVMLGLLPYATGGFIGVLVFFVLSGYLIGAIVWRAPVSLTWYRAYLRRRVQRLAPVLLALAVVLPPVMVLRGAQDWSQALGSAAQALTQTTAFFLAAGTAWHPVWGPTWSLTVEWTYYLLFPAVVLLARARRVPGRVIARGAAVVAAALFLVAQPLSPEAFYLLPVANVGVMVAGGALAVHHATRPASGPTDPARGTFALGLIAVLSVLPGSTLGAGTRYVVMPAVTVGTVLVIDALRGGGSSPLQRLLASKPLAGMGIRAYSIYIWHVPVLWLTWSFLPDAPPLLTCAVGAALLVPVVALSFRFLERPWLSSGARRTPDTVAAPGGTVASGSTVASPAGRPG